MSLPRIISVDDHVVEPPHVWQTWLPEKYRERGPKVEDKKWGGFRHLSGAKYDMHEDPDGEWGSAWYYDDELIYVHKKFVAIPRASTTLDDKGEIVFDRTQMTMTAITYDAMRKGCWDRDERVKDLALNYTDGSLPFPTFPRFCGQTFYEAKDKELALACVIANNDWMVEEWCAPSGGVNLPLCLIPLWDVELAAKQHRAYGQPAAHQSSQLVDLAAQRLGLGEHGAGARRDERTGLGQLDGPRRAPQQLDAELPLELTNLMRERGLGHVQLGCGVGEVAVAGDGLEVAQLADVHAGRFSSFRDQSIRIIMLDG